MLNLERALTQDRLLRALTGLNRKAFDALLPSFEQAYEARRDAAKPERKRREAADAKRDSKALKRSCSTVCSTLSAIRRLI